jgi:hypothetical protein
MTDAEKPLGQCRRLILPLAAVTAAIRCLIEEDSFPRAPRGAPVLGAGKARSGGGATAAADSQRRPAGVRLRRAASASGRLS